MAIERNSRELLLSLKGQNGLAEVKEPFVVGKMGYPGPAVRSVPTSKIAAHMEPTCRFCPFFWQRSRGSDSG